MADEAGPSGSAPPVTPEMLAEADRKFERGIQCIRTNDLERAVQLFAEVLQTRTQAHGELAPECAAAYYRYGAALLYQAQDSGELFAGGQEGEEEEQEEEPEAAAEKENGGKGKAPVAAAPSADEGGSQGGEEGEEDSAAAGGDLQLAWENLEAAKVIWSRDAAANAQQLADVHGLLGDVAMESDDFATALAELDAALGHLAAVVQEDDRRIAEVQYKRCCALQFSAEPEGALAAVQAALDCLAKRRASLQAKLAAPGEGDDVEKMRAEVEEVGALQEDLGEKVAELKDAIASDVDTKNMLKGLFAQAAGGGSAPAAPTQPAAAAAPAAGGEGTEQAGFDAPSAAAAAGGAGAGAAPVKNLGVVGRGTKRINLQPVQTNVPAAAPGSGAAPAEPPAKKKRSLEDLMGGGSGGETTVGFGAPAAAEAPENAGAGAATPAPAVPAFLQASSVAAVYSSAEKAAGGGQ